MSKQLAVIDNQSDTSLQILRYDQDSYSLPQNCFGLQPGAYLSLNSTVDVPKNSDCTQYFLEHHIEIQDESGIPLFSFWNNDASGQNYKLQWCTGTDFISGILDYTNNGTDDGEGTVGVVVGGKKGAYTLDFYDTTNPGMPRTVSKISSSLGINLTQTKKHNHVIVNPPKPLGHLANLTLSQLSDNSYTASLSSVSPTSDSFLQIWIFATTCTYTTAQPPQNGTLQFNPFVAASKYFSEYYSANGSKWVTGTKKDKPTGKTDEFIFTANWDGQWKPVSLTNGSGWVPVRWMAANGGENGDSEPGSGRGPKDEPENATWSASG